MKSKMDRNGQFFKWGISKFCFKEFKNSLLYLVAQ